MTYVVVAEFKVRQGKAEEFAAFMRTHAELSLAEPGCRLFEVNQDAADPSRFLFYEVFDDEAAYREHRAEPHYQRWGETAPRLVVAQDGELFVRRTVFVRRSP